MAHSSLRPCLDELRFTADLPAAMLDRLAEIASLQRFAAGAVLFREGAHHESLYLLCSGRVAIEMRVPGRGNVRIMSLGPGDVVGWSALLGGGPMTASAVALEPCEVLAIPGAELAALCASDHELGHALMRQMATALSRRLVATRLQLLDLFEETCAERPFAPPGDEP